MKEKVAEKNKLGELPDSEMRLSDLFITIAKALDMGSYEILDHSNRVAYIALEIAEELALEEKYKNKIVLAALIHDIGITNNHDKKRAQGFFTVEKDIAQNHSKVGAELLKNIRFMPELDDIIYYHHHDWSVNNFDENQIKGAELPLASRVIRLADRIEASINPDICLLMQSDEIIRNIKSKSGSWFDPKLVEIFIKLAQKESFWLNLKSKEYLHILENWGEKTKTNIDLYDLESLASTVAHLIDRISPFTSRHSSGVATIAAMITNEMGYGLQEQRSMRIAGLFHDLGKLTIPDNLIEKEGELTKKEYKVVKQHSYYSYQLLNKVEGLGSIPEWGAFHHERLDGTGYPFRLKAENLNIGSRIMAVSDVFQALTEDRPYRVAFSIAKALEIIQEMQENFKLDKKIISVLKSAI